MKHHEGFKKIAAMICAALVLPYAAIPVGSAENLIMGDVNEDAIVDPFRQVSRPHTSPRIRLRQRLLPDHQYPEYNRKI